MAIFRLVKKIGSEFELKKTQQIEDEFGQRQIKYWLKKSRKYETFKIKIKISKHCGEPTGEIQEDSNRNE